MGVIPSMPLKMCGSLYLIIISYLLQNDLEDLEAKLQSWIDNMEG